MNIQVYSTHNQVPDGILKDKNVLIIDVLRATSVIGTALDNGARKVMTSPSIEEAFARKKQNPELLLGGERLAVKVKGFDFGNSPLEYSPDKIKKRTILLSTTNGTQAVNKALGAKRIIAASFLNLNSVVDYILNLDQDFELICSGTNGNFSLDDGLCAGLILHELRKKQAIISTDFAEILALPFRKNDYSLNELIKPAFHLALLKRKGHQEDIDYCLSLNKIKTIPIWDTDGFISLNHGGDPK